MRERERERERERKKERDFNQPFCLGNICFESLQENIRIEELKRCKQLTWLEFLVDLFQCLYF